MLRLHWIRATLGEPFYVLNLRKDLEYVKKILTRLAVEPPRWYPTGADGSRRVPQAFVMSENMNSK